MVGRDRRGDPSPLSEGVEILLDTRAPRAEVRFQEWRRTPGPLQLTLRVDEVIEGDPELSLTLTDRPPLPVVLKSAGEREWAGEITVPEDAPDGEARFAFTASDPSGNVGRWISRGATVYVDQDPPVGDLWFDPAPPLRGGVETKVVLTLHEAVSEPPNLTLRAQGAGPAIELAPTSDARRFTGTLLLPEDVPDGVARFSLAAVDAFGHRGGRILRYVEVTIGDGPPRAVYENPAPPTGVLTWEEGRRPLPLSLELSKSCASVELALKASDGSVHEVKLEGSGNRYQGVLDLPADVPDGPATFLLSATDLTGQSGDRLTRGEMILLCRAAPAAPLAAVATAGPGGSVVISWEAPPSKTSLPVPISGYRVRRKGSGVESGLRKALSYTDQTEQDGEFIYEVMAVSRMGVAGPVATTSAVRSDREPPAKPGEAPALKPARQGRAVEITFGQVPEAAAYRIYRSSEGADFVVAGESATSPLVDPAPGGKLRYAVSALDAAGNEGPRSEVSEIDFTSALPVGRVTFDPPPPLVTWPVAVVLRTTLPLSEAPELRLVGADGSEVPIELAGAGSEWKGTLAAPSDLPEGRASLAFLGRALIGGEEVESSLLAGTTTFDVDARPPEFHIALGGEAPREGDKWMLRAGEYPVTLRSSEATAAPPTLSFVPAGATEGIPLELKAFGATAWSTTLVIDEETAQGAGFFEVHAADAAGNEGQLITRGKVAEVRTREPAGLARMRVAAGFMGSVILQWLPPDDELAHRFEVYRARAPQDGGAEPEAVPERPVASIDWTLGYTDHPGGGAWLYAVRVVDAAGNRGVLSPWARVEVDLSPPAAPVDLKGEVLATGNVRLEWKPGEGEPPAYYNIYFADGEIRDPAKARRMNDTYPFTEIYGAPPEDGTFTFFVTAVDKKFNEGPPSEGLQLEVSHHPPIATIRIFDEAGERANALRAASYRVELEATQALSAPPVLSYVLFETEAKIPVELAPDGPLWRGTLRIPDDAREGAAYFAVRLLDEQGNEGGEIQEGEYFVVDRSPPGPVEEPRAELDRSDQLGAIDLSWGIPKGEAPHFYRVFRRKAGEEDEQLLRRVKVEKVKARYTLKDVPPEDGAWAYRIQGQDRSGNLGPLSEPLEAESKTRVPKAKVETRTDFSGEDVVTVVGLGSVEVHLVASSPLESPPSLSLAIEEHTVPIAMEADGSDGRSFRGRFVVTEDTPEGEAELRFEGRDREGRVGRFVSSGSKLTIDRTLAEAEITIEDLFELLPNRYTGKLQRVPVRAGLRRVKLTTSKRLSAPPVLEAAPEGGDRWIPVVLRGRVPGSSFAGDLDVPATGPEGAWRFRFRGTDLMGNETTEIAEPRRSFRTEDNDTGIARILQTFETTGESFTVDVAAPEAPELTKVEHLKLGVLAFEYQPRGEKPITYNLYRDLKPIVTLDGLRPVRKEIRAEVIVDDPPCDARWFWAVTALDAARNESLPSNVLSAVVDSIKPELKIKPVPSEDFVILELESEEKELSLSLNWPGGRRAVLGGDSGELEVERDPVTGAYRHRIKLLPQQLEVFNGKVEIVVHSPDPAGNIVEQTSEVSVQTLNAATGAVVESVDQGAALVIPPGARPVIPGQPQRQVTGRNDLVFFQYVHVPRDPKAVPKSPRDPGPLPLELEMLSRPYRVELNQDTEEPLELLASASQARIPELPKIVFSVGEMADLGDQYSDPEFMKDRIKVVRWTPPEKGSKKKGRWEVVPDIQIDLENWKVIAPANKVTSYVVVAETTPPSVRDMEPRPEATVAHLRPRIAARIVDKGTGVAVGPENKIALTLDGELKTAVIDDSDPTEVTVSFATPEDLSPGPHVVSLYAEDVVENARTATWRFTIDTEPPRVLSVMPREEVPTSLPRPLIGAEVLDSGGGIDPDSILLRLDGKLLAARFDAAGSWVCAHPPSTISAGLHQVELRVSDRGGEEARREWSFHVDRSGPSVTRLVPDAGAAVSELEKLSAVLTDAPAGLDPDSVQLSLDGVPLGRGSSGVAGYAFEAGAGHVAYRPPEPLSEGWHEATIIACDQLGNATHFTFRFAVDRSPPTVTALAAWRPELERPLLALELGDLESGLPEAPAEIRVSGTRIPPEMIRDGSRGRIYLRPPPAAGGGERRGGRGGGPGRQRDRAQLRRAGGYRRCRGLRQSGSSAEGG